MAKQHYFLKLIPPRPTLARDMTHEERFLMEEHGRYLQEHFTAGKVLLFGPVMANDGAFGVAILEMDDEAEATAWRRRSFSESRTEQIRGLPHASIRRPRQRILKGTRLAAIRAD